MITGASDDMDTRPAADILHHGNVAPQVQGCNVDDGSDAARVGFGKRSSGGVGDGRQVLETGIGGRGASGSQRNVLVAQGEPQIGGIHRAQHRVDC